MNKAIKYAAAAIIFASAITGTASAADSKSPVDYVNPYIGNISHLLVPTFPTVHLPNSMMRVYPVRDDYTTDYIKGLPLIVPDHRKGSVVNFAVRSGSEYGNPKDFRLSYDNERTTPYSYSVFLDTESISVKYAPSHRSAIYRLSHTEGKEMTLLFTASKGEVVSKGNIVCGFQIIPDSDDKVYFFIELDQCPSDSSISNSRKTDAPICAKNGEILSLTIPAGKNGIGLRYGISFISSEQARKNLETELSVYGFDHKALSEDGRKLWNDVLGKISVKGDEEEKTVFYTSLYRTYERPVCISEDGYYYSAFDKKVHSDGGRPFYVDDWLWDTYRATHPMRLLIEQELEADILNSYVKMTDHMPDGQRWLPTFPKITGDSRGMNCNHGVISLYDAMVKGCEGFDYEKAYTVSEGALNDKTLIPWKGTQACELDDFYKEKGYFPALQPGEPETVADVNPFEKRQAVAVTLGTSYDHWALSGMARMLGKDTDADKYMQMGLNYRHLFNPETGFFHPKDVHGEFIRNLDYNIGGGIGGREYYDENNAYTYRWDVAHNIHDLISLNGGQERFCSELDKLFTTGLGMGKLKFYNLFGGNQTGAIGQFSIGNEPSFHIPYLYIYAGQSWKTQKRIRTILNMWFRNDLMGIPGDEDGGGMSAFVLMSQIGIYPVTPGTPIYCIGTPAFSSVEMTLSNGKKFRMRARNLSDENKYIQSAKLNGTPYDNAWLLHNDIIAGGILELVMGPRPNKNWGTTPPPSYYNNSKPSTEL